jgi:putative membrane protein
MIRLIFGLIINSVALWAADSLVEGIHLHPFGDQPSDVMWSYVAIAALFGVINAVIGNFIRIVAFPIYILTLGLVAIVVNAGLLMLAAGATPYLGFGLEVDGFWWGVAGALVLSLSNWLLGIILRPLLKPTGS